MKKFLVIFFVLAFGVSFQGFAQQGPLAGRFGIMKDLKLTSDQEAQFKTIHFETRKKNIEKKAALETARLELNQLFDAETQDKAAIEKKIGEIASIQSSIKINLYNAWADCNKMLNKDQQKIWKRTLMTAMDHQRMNFRGMQRRSMSPRMMMNRRNNSWGPGNMPDPESH